MNGNFEWQRQQAKQRLQSRYAASEQHRLGKKKHSVAANGESPSRTSRPRLRLVTVILNLFR
jgi:hypothetical protein